MQDPFKAVKVREAYYIFSFFPHEKTQSNLVFC